MKLKRPSSGLTRIACLRDCAQKPFQWCGSFCRVTGKKCAFGHWLIWANSFVGKCYGTHLPEMPASNQNGQLFISFRTYLLEFFCASSRGMNLNWHCGYIMTNQSIDTISPKQFCSWSRRNQSNLFSIYLGCIKIILHLLHILSCFYWNYIFVKEAFSRSEAIELSFFTPRERHDCTLLPVWCCAITLRYYLQYYVKTSTLF